MTALESWYERAGRSRHSFRCCDTTFVVQSTGVRADAATRAARKTADTLEAQLDSFDRESDVSRLHREGTVTNEHVARIVRRGLEYYDRTDGVFDVRQGRAEVSLKSYLRGEDTAVPESFAGGSVQLDGDRVSTDGRLDLNGLAKGYIVDAVASSLDGLGRFGFVSGGGDMSPPSGPIAIESPYTGEKPLKTLDTSWSVATSGGYRRRRDGLDHIYDPTTETVGSDHESVTVLARRDCMEADALATTLAALERSEAIALAEDWPGLEAFLVHEGVFHTTSGFDDHVFEQ